MPHTHPRIRTALQAVNGRAARGSLALLEPTSRNRSLVVSSLLQASERPVFYYALGPDDVDLSIFLGCLGMALADQKPLGGRNLLALTGAQTVSLDAWMKALLADLHELGDDFILVLDEYDRSDESDEVQIFMTALAGQLPENVTILLNTRTIPRLPWIALAAKKRATVIFPEDPDARLPAAVQAAAHTPAIDMFALGPGFVLLNDTPIDDWEGHLPRLLFFFTLERPAVTRSELCAAFWPMLDDEQAVNVFHVTKRRLHKALGVDVLIHENGFYMLNPNIRLSSDVRDFADCLILARQASAGDRMRYLQNAVDIYRGPYLQGHDDAWILERRADYLDGYIEALTGLAEAQIASRRDELALDTLLRAVAADPLRPAVQARALELYIRMGRRLEAAAHYQALRDRLKKQRQKMWPEVSAVFRKIASRA